MRDSVVLGHRLAVHPSDDGRWDVTIDGERIISRSLPSAYAAWAVGAAESYRQGRVVAPPRVHD
ncbi:MAG TPA: hypothetical protein VFG59_03195 [Anaeromyxobacter sp.]|nr:hypothetical protein [Anaeromyxobacter sp.]